MSEEVSSSTPAAGAKHVREEEEEAEETNQAKKQRLDEDGESGPCTSSTSGVTSAGRSGEGASGSGEGVGGSGEGVGGSGEGVSASGEGVSGSGEGVGGSGEGVGGSGGGDGGSGEGVSGSGEGVTSESDEEYQVGGSESDGDLSSAGEDGNDAESSDISVEEEEEGEGEGSNIVNALGVELREIKDGKYRLYHQQSVRELKILLSEDAITSAEKIAREKQSDNQIAVLDAQGAEITRDDRDEVIVYATSLTMSDTKYQFYNDELDLENSNDDSVLLQGNKLAVVRIDGIKEVFATIDFAPQESED